jgi:hypothetical protein
MRIGKPITSLVMVIKRSFKDPIADWWLGVPSLELGPDTALKSSWANSLLPFRIREVEEGENSNNSCIDGCDIG